MSRNLRRAIGALLAAVAIGAGASPAKAEFVNGSFETGDFSGWSTIGHTSNVGSLGIVIPPDGARQAFLTNDSVVGAVSQANIEAFLGITAGSLDTLGNGDAVEGSAIKQTITVSAGTVLTFRWNFLTNENTPSDFNDFAFVSIVSGTTQTLANTGYNGGNFLAATGTGFGEMTGYQTFTHTFTTAGTYTIGVGVMDGTDLLVLSGLLVDNFQASAVNPVPAPPGAVLFAVGTLGLASGRVLRRRMTPVAA